VGPAPQVAGEARAAASAQALAVPRAAGRLAAAAPRELAAALAGFLARVCAAGALRVADRAARTPEALGLRALPQFATLAAAQKVCVPEELARRPTRPGNISHACNTCRGHGAGERGGEAHSWV